MNEPFLPTHKTVQKTVGKMSNFVEFFVQGGVDSIILCFSFISSAIRFTPVTKFEPEGINIGRIISVGIPVIVADAFAHCLNSFLVKKSGIEAEQLREEYPQDVKKDTNVTENNIFYASGIIYFVVYLAFAFLILLPFIVCYKYENISQNAILIWFILTAVLELVVIAIVKDNFTSAGFLRSLVDVCAVGILAAGVAFTIGFIMD